MKRKCLITIVFFAVCSLVAQILGHVTWFVNSMGHKKVTLLECGTASYCWVTWVGDENCGLIPAPEAPVMVKVKQKQQEAKENSALKSPIQAWLLMIANPFSKIRYPLPQTLFFVKLESVFQNIWRITRVH